MHQDPDEQFAGNTSINAEIHEMLVRTPEPSRSRMRKKIRQQRDALRKNWTEQKDADARHVFWEFIIGVRLNDNGLRLEYNARIGNQTPDWYDENNKLLLEVFTCERGGRWDPVRRVAARIEEKVERYKRIIEDRDLRFIVAVHGDFVTFFEVDDCKQAIDDGCLFEHLPNLSGVVFFAESNVQRVKKPDGSTRYRALYQFHYFPNPNARCKIDLDPYLT